MKKRLTLLLAAAVMLSGCSKPAADKESAATEETSATDAPTAETAQAIPTAAAPEFSSEPVGSAAQSGGVSLVEDKFAKYKELTDFGGEYTTLEESGLEYRIVDISDIAEHNYRLLNAWGGKLYYMDSEYKDYAPDGTLEPNSDMSYEVFEYDFESGSMRQIELPDFDGEPVYVDDEFMVFSRTENAESDYFGYITNRIGLTFYDIANDRYFDVDAENVGEVYRVGRSFYYNARIRVDYTYNIPVIGRCRPAVSHNSIILENARLACPLSDGAVISVIGGLEYYDGLSGDTTMYSGISEYDLNSSGDMLCCMEIRDSDKLFGNSWEVCYYPHPQVKKRAFITGCGITPYSLCVSESGFLYSCFYSDRPGIDTCGLLFDTKNNRAIVLPRLGEYAGMSGTWMYMRYLEDGAVAGYIAINTAAED